jgi:hypothetical protein
VALKPKRFQKFPVAAASRLRHRLSRSSGRRNSTYFPAALVAQQASFVQIGRPSIWMRFGGEFVLDKRNPYRAHL